MHDKAEAEPRIFMLLPGMDGTGLLFEPFVRFLPANREAVVISYPRDNFLSYNDLANRVHRAIPKGAFVIIAESYSGPVAALVGARRPPGLKAIVFVNSFVRFPIGRSGAMLARFIPDCLSHVLKWTGFPQRCLIQACPVPEVVVALQSALSLVSPTVLSMRLKAALSADASEMLQRCNARTICLVSREDHVLRNRSLRELQAAKPDTEVITVPGPHLLLQCAPLSAISALRKLGLL